jgi:hypothetical protein
MALAFHGHMCGACVDRYADTLIVWRTTRWKMYGSHWAVLCRQCIDRYSFIMNDRWNVTLALPLWQPVNPPYEQLMALELWMLELSRW